MTGTLNKVMLIGHLGDDVKIHYFDGGGSIGRFPLATNESYVNKSTELLFIFISIFHKSIKLMIAFHFYF